MTALSACLLKRRTEGLRGPTLIPAAALASTMKFFREAGKKFESAKRSVMDSDDVEYRCTACEEALTQSYDTCPYCDADAVSPVA